MAGRSFGNLKKCSGIQIHVTPMNMGTIIKNITDIDRKYGDMPMTRVKTAESKDDTFLRYRKAAGPRSTSIGTTLYAIKCLNRYMKTGKTKKIVRHSAHRIHWLIVRGLDSGVTFSLFILQMFDINIKMSMAGCFPFIKACDI